MELLIIIAVILLLLVVSGIAMQAIVSGVLILTLAAAFLVLLFFVVCVISLIGSEKISVRFEKVDKKDEKSFERAYYTDGENSYPNAFPYEKLFRSVLYIPGKQTKVRLCRKKDKVFDKMALLVVLLGLILSGVSVTAISAYVMKLL